MYYLVGLQPEGNKFFYFVFVLMLSYLNMEALCSLVLALVEIPIIATTLCVVTVGLYMLMNSFLQPLDDMPRYLFWIAYACPSFYSFNGLLVNQLDGVTYTGAGIDTYAGRELLRIAFNRATDHSKWGDIGLMILILFIFRFNLYVILRLKLREFTFVRF